MHMYTYISYRVVAQDSGKFLPQSATPCAPGATGLPPTRPHEYEPNMNKRIRINKYIYIYIYIDR